MRDTAKTPSADSTDLCLKPNRATVKYGAHNGLARSEHPPLAIGCKGKGKKKNGRQRHHALRSAVGGEG